MTYKPTSAELRKRWHGFADKLCRDEALRLCERTFNMAKFAPFKVAQQARHEALVELLCKGVQK